MAEIQVAPLSELTPGKVVGAVGVSAAALQRLGFYEKKRCALAMKVSIRRLCGLRNLHNRSDQRTGIAIVYLT